MEFHTHCEEETEALGQALAARLKPGTILAYEGDLGAGKTALTRGIARGLGITDPVTSPTYNIVNEYMGRLPLFHFDMYRLTSSEDLFDIGWEEYLERGGILAVEWSSRVADVLDGAVKIRMEKVPHEETGRKITIEGGEELADFSI